MPIIPYPGYITKEEAALQHKIKTRTVTDWISRNLAASKGISFIKIDGFVFIADKHNPPVPPKGVLLANLEQVRKFSERHDLYFERVYEEILHGNISGVLLCGRVFVMNNEPALLTFLKNHQPKRKY
ncbi:MAG: hypothetical protein V4615_03660 [Bacteroidota bacterium]